MANLSFSHNLVALGGISERGFISFTEACNFLIVNPSDIKQNKYLKVNKRKETVIKEKNRKNT